MSAITDYSEAVRDSRNALRYYKQVKTYTKAHLTAWGELARDRFTDTEFCVNADLRNAFVHGCIMGYEFPLVLSAPSCYDRLQADAYMEGVSHGEAVWGDEHDDI